MRAIILSVGDELVLGQIVDTNSAFVSTKLASIGVDVVRHVTVGDDQRGIEDAIRAAMPDCKAIIITGGIGPTADDLTRQALAGVLGVELDQDDRWLAHIEAFFKRLGRVMPPGNRIQAMIPRGSKLLWNHNGTAAGIHSMFNGVDIFSVPGVPKEMRPMIENDVLPVLSKQTGTSVILSEILHTFGVGESAVAEKLGALMDRNRNPTVGTPASAGIVSLRINARFDSMSLARKSIAATIELCRSALGDVIYGSQDDTLVTVVAQMLKDHRKTVSTAESCTGGLLAKYLTDVSGSSAYISHGWVTYSNAAKSSELGVDAKLIEHHGAVSEVVAGAMAEGAMKNSGSDIGIGISGIAGPDGGTETKPVGTVCIALASKTSSTHTRTFQFPGDREMIRDRAAKMGLSMIRFHLIGRQMGF